MISLLIRTGVATITCVQYKRTYMEKIASFSLVVQTILKCYICTNKQKCRVNVKNNISFVRKQNVVENQTFCTILISK